MNGWNKSRFPRLGLAALVVLLVSAASVPALAQVPGPGSSTVTIDPDGSVAKGVATVSGTFTVPPALGPLIVRVALSQSHRGGPTKQAFTDIGPIATDGPTQSWAAIMVPDTAFSPGQADVIVQVLSADGTALAGATATVRLLPTQN